MPTLVHVLIEVTQFKIEIVGVFSTNEDAVEYAKTHAVVGWHIREVRMNPRA